MRFEGVAYRGVNPKWSFSPTSGDGAAIYGARFNPKGVPALYLATTPEGAFAEATQGFAFKFRPLTLCSYSVDCADIIDLSTDAARKAAGISYSDMSSAWKAEQFENKVPRSWKIHEALHDKAAGLLVPSFAINAAPDMLNLILWTWSDRLPHRVVVHDPDNRLPTDQSSWRT